MKDPSYPRYFLDFPLLKVSYPFTAGLIFISGGMNIAWCMGFRGPIIYQTDKHNFIAWFIGAIIGAVITCGLTNKVPKKMVLVSNARAQWLEFPLHIVFPTAIRVGSGHDRGPGDRLHKAERECNHSRWLPGRDSQRPGFCSFMALAAELSMPYTRGVNATSTEQLCFSIGIFLQIIYTTSWSYNVYNVYNEFSAENMKGVLSTIFGFLALIFGSFMTIESPVLMLANNDEAGAMDALRRLQNPAVMTQETYEQLAEHKRYLAANKDMTLGQSISQALPTFLRLGYLRALNAMSFSSFVVFTLSLSIYLGYGLGERKAGILPSPSAAGWARLFPPSAPIRWAGRSPPFWDCSWPPQYPSPLEGSTVSTTT